MMILDHEKKMIKNGLAKLKKIKGFERFLEYPPVLGPISEIMLSMGKDVAIAQGFRMEGNNFFTKNSHNALIHHSIIEAYNRSVSTAPPNSESLALAYGNRSAILEHIGRYKECISQIDRAVTITKSPSLILKLLCRKAKCVAVLGSSDGSKYLEQAKHCLKKLKKEEKVKKTAFAELIKKTEMIVQEIIQNSSRLDEKNVEVSELISKAEVDGQSAVEITYSDTCGRHLIAARDIEPGEILSVEKAINTSVEQEQAHLYCWHCSSFLWDIIPCDSCTTSCFCSEKCKIESWEQYHALECNILRVVDTNYLQLSSFHDPPHGPPSHQLGLRIFIKALKQAKNVHDLRAMVESMDEYPDQQEEIPKDDFRHVLPLSSNTSKCILDELAKDTVLHLVFMARFTSVFGEIVDPCDFSLERIMSNDDILFMGALLLRFCAIADAQGFYSLQAPNCENETFYKNSCYGLISWSLGAKTSLTHYSCIPNAKRCLISENKIILYSIMAIKKGAKIHDSSLSIFDDFPSSERQKDFRDRHGTSCECRSCEENWPDMRLESGIRQYYAKMSSALSDKSHRMFRDYLSILTDTTRNLSALEKLSKLSALIGYAMEESPLPSKSTAFMIKGLISFIENTYGISKPQIPNNGCSA